MAPGAYDGISARIAVKAGGEPSINSSTDVAQTFIPLRNTISLTHKHTHTHACLSSPQTKTAEALYQTGAGTSASRLARADLGFFSQGDLVEAVAISAAVGGARDTCKTLSAEEDGGRRRLVPVISDADVGWGAPPQVVRTVQKMHAAGMAAIHFEDQVTSKRCGHLAD